MPACAQHTFNRLKKNSPEAVKIGDLEEDPGIASGGEAQNSPRITNTIGEIRIESWSYTIIRTEKQKFPERTLRRTECV